MAIVPVIKDGYMSKKEENIGGLMTAIIVAVVAFNFLATGCAGPLLLGVKKYTGSDGSVTEFITGADFTIGANGLDSVSNNRGIEPDRYKKQ